MRAKVMHGFMVVGLLFMQLLNLGGVRVAAAAAPDQIEQVITTSDALEVKLTGQVTGDQINWALTYHKKDQGELRALKVRVSTDQAATLRLTPKATQLMQALQGQDAQPKHQWWIEKAYSRSSQGVLHYSTPKTNNRLYVAVELNRRESGTKQSTATTTTTAAADDDAAIPVDSTIENSTVGPVEVVLPLTQATAAEQAVAIDRPAANTPQTAADAARTVDATVAQVAAIQGTLDGRVYAKQYDHNQNTRYSGDGSIPYAYSNANDPLGRYPTQAWAVGTDDDVKNHIGGNTQDSKLYDPSGVTSSTSAKTWLDFGADRNDPDFSIRKFAKETDTPGLFDVQLDVKGNTVSERDPIALVLVLDYSGSMAGDRRTAMITGVEKFLDAIQAAGLGNDVSVGVVGYSEGIDAIFTVDVAPVSQNIDTIKTKIKAEAVGGTFTQTGLRQGQQMLEKVAIEDKRMILLTDGVPTFAYKVTAARELADGTIIGTAFSGTREGQGWTAELAKAYSVNGHQIRDTWAATLGEAADIKNRGMTLQALGIQLGNDENYMSAARVEAQMKKLPSLGSNGQPLYEAADSAEAVTAYLRAQATQVISSYNTISAGSIHDPLGAQFSYATTTPKVTTYGGAATPTATITGRQLTVTNLNLGQGQRATITYQVRINTEAEGFKPDHWYAINGSTTLTPQPEQEPVDFGIPSAKAPSATYTVKKAWQHLQGQTLPKQLNVTVARQGSAFANEQDLSLTPDDWTATFQDVAYGNTGQALAYTVTAEESDGTYLATQTYDKTTRVLTLTNVQYGVQVEKKSTDGNKIDAEDVAFTLNTYETAQFTQAQASTLTAGLPQGLTTGFYGIKETAAPEGYELDETEYLFARDAAGKWFYYGARTANSGGVQTAQPITGTMDLNVVEDQVDQFSLNKAQNLLTLTKYNAPKRSLELVLVKKNTLGGYLAGAEFTLTGPQPSTETETLTSVASQAGVTAAAKLFGGDVYTLVETEAPGGYEKLNGQVAITVNEKGTAATVTVDGKALTAGGLTVNGYAYRLDGNKLIITAHNKPAESVLPVTGGPGLKAYMAGALLLMVAAGAVGVARRYLKEQEGQ